MKPFVVDELKMSNKINRGSSECHACRGGGGGGLLTLMYRGAVLLAAEAPLARVPQCFRGFP